MFQEIKLTLVLMGWVSTYDRMSFWFNVDKEDLAYLDHDHVEITLWDGIKAYGDFQLYKLNHGTIGVWTAGEYWRLSADDDEHYHLKRGKGFASFCQVLKEALALVE